MSTEPREAAPQISVIIPSIGRASLRQAVESALDQSVAALEIIVVFDLPEVPEDLGLPPGVRVETTGGGLGPNAARQVGIDAAHGDAIALLDDDDYWYPEKLAAQMRLLTEIRRTRKMAIVTAGTDIVDHAGRRLHGPGRVIASDQSICDYLFRRRGFRGSGASSFGPSSLLVDRALFTAEPLNPDLRIHEDWDWLLRASARPDVAHAAVGDALLAYRLPEPGRVTTSSRHWRRSLDWATERSSILSPREFGDFLLTVSAAVAVEAGERRGAARIIATALRRGRPGFRAVVVGLGFLLMPRQSQNRTWEFLDRITASVRTLGSRGAATRRAESGPGRPRPDEMTRSGPSETSGRAQWLDFGDGPIYGVLHSPAPTTTAAPIAAVMVPPFGWTDTESYRARRYWAVRLARSGHPCLRLDLPGTGDSSGGPLDPDLVERWIAAIRGSARWVKQTTGAERVALIGVDLGGLLALRAASEEEAVSDLILWGTRARGRPMLRTLIAYARMVASKHPEDQLNEQQEGVNVTGFLLTPETQRAISDLDVAAMDFVNPSHLRVLLLASDNLGVDSDLADALIEAGVSTTSMGTSDYQDLLVHPQSLTMRRPDETIDRSIEWLGDSPSARAPAPGARTRPASSARVPAEISDTALVRAGTAEVRETIIPVRVGDARTFAILTEPTEGPRSPVGAVLLSPGALRKAGPHRMWVEIARRWAARGVPTVRFDLEAVGDAEGPGDTGGDERSCVTNSALTSPESVEAARGVLAQLTALRVAERFALVGHCSGAYVGFHAALEDPAVIGVVGINLTGWYWNEALHQNHIMNLIKTALRSGLWQRLRQRGVTRHELRQIQQAVGHRLRHGSGPLPEVEQRRVGEMLLDRSHAQDVRIVLLMSDEGSFVEYLRSAVFTERSASHWPNLRVEELPTTDHMARALWLQQLQHDRLDSALEDLLSTHDPVTADRLRTVTETAGSR